MRRRSIVQLAHRLTTCLLLASLAACSGSTEMTASSTTDKPDSTAFSEPETTTLGRLASSIAADHDGDSGFALLDRGRDALAWRLILADAAERSIDAMYFLWKNDAVGKVMMQRLLAAAERGVRVRVLIDDSMTESDPEYLALFGAHPNVELRLYKPFGPKQKSLRRWIDFAAHFKVNDRRMHNKLFVVDASVEVIGGRNIGDEYFEYADEFVFRSRDLSLRPRLQSQQAAEEPRTVDVERVAGAMSVGLDDVAEAWPIGKSFWQKQDGSLDLGFSFTQASSQLQYNLNFSNTFSGRRFKIPVNISSSVTRVDGDTTSNRQVIGIAWMRDLRWEEWFGIVLGGVESNDELDLSFRASGGGGAGRYLGRSSRYDWAAYGAVVATQERYTSTSADTGASLVAGTDLSLFVYGEHDLTFDTSFQAIPSITGSSRVRLDLQSSVSYEFLHGLYLGFNFYDQFDSNPPLATAQQNDFGVSTSLGYKW